MTNKKLLSKLQDILKSAKIEEYEFEATCIFEDCTGIKRSRFLLVKDEIPDKETAQKAIEIARKRADERYPLQYLLGVWEFYDCEFKVGEGVLIPRPDTETVIEVLRQDLSVMSELRIADLCSGSGCIGIVLAKKFKNSEVIAVEKSEDALKYLYENIKRNEVPLKVFAGDVCDEKFIAENFTEKFEVIVSNPPYLTEIEMGELETEVKFEPEMALLGGADGLYFYREITALWKDKLNENGILCYEIGYKQSEDVEKILRNAGFSNVRTVKDLGGNDRVVIGSLK